MDLDERFAKVRDDIELLRKRQAKLAHEKEILKASLTSAKNSLKKDFGVTTAKEAKDLIVSLEATLNKLLGKIEETLKAVNSDGNF